jgi:hypothetical protein
MNNPFWIIRADQLIPKRIAFFGQDRDSHSRVIGGGLAFGLSMVPLALGAIPRVGEYLQGQWTAWTEGLVKGAATASAWPAL